MELNEENPRINDGSIRVRELGFCCGFMKFIAVQNVERVAQHTKQ